MNIPPLLFRYPPAVSVGRRALSSLATASSLPLVERNGKRSSTSTWIPTNVCSADAPTIRAATGALGHDTFVLQCQSFASHASGSEQEETSSESQHQRNEPSSMENDLLRAELAGLSGSDEAYEALMMDLSNALEHLEQTAQGDDEDALIDALQSAGKCYWNIGLLDESRELYEDVLTRLITIHNVEDHSNKEGQPPDHPAIASTLHTLGSIHARSGDPTEATKWYESALAMKKRLYGNRTFHPEIGRTLNGLATLKVHAASDGSEVTHSHGEDEDWEHAMRLFEEAERNYRYHGLDRGGGGRTGSIKTGGDANYENGDEEEDYSNHPDLASICENMALLYRRSGNHQAALGRYQEALQIRTAGPEEASANDNGTLGLTLGIADCLRAMTKWDEAAEMYEGALANHLQAKAIEATADAEDGDDSGESWLTFASKNESEKDVEETGTALESVIRHNLGLIHAERGRSEHALEEYEISRRIKVALAGDTHPEVAATLNAIGAVYGSKGERERALAHFREALYIYRLHSAELGDDDPDVVKTQRNIRLIEKSALKTGKEDPLTMM